MKNAPLTCLPTQHFGGCLYFFASIYALRHQCFLKTFNMIIGIELLRALRSTERLLDCSIDYDNQL